jgi:hypothetical protein
MDIHPFSSSLDHLSLKRDNEKGGSLKLSNGSDLN